VPAASGPAPQVGRDTVGLIPPRLGSLKQEAIALRFSLSAAVAQAHPLDESVIRVLAPDSYRTVRTILDSQRANIERRAREHQLRERQLWYVTFYALAPNAQFTSGDLTISQTGRDYRPVDVIPITGGFAQGRLDLGRAASAIYVYEDGLDVNQPLIATMGRQRNAEWEMVLRTIATETALIRSRKG
jgi:hypothetical protein